MAAPIANPLLRVALFCLALIIGSLIMAVVGALYLRSLLGAEFYQLLGQGEHLPYFLLLYLPQFLFFLGLVWLFSRFVDQRHLSSLGLEAQRALGWLAKGAALGALLIALIFIVSWLAGGLQVLGVAWQWSALIGYVLLFAMVALGEELVFRGYIFTNLCEHLGEKRAVLLSSVLFSLVHLGNDNVISLAVLNIFLAGLLLGVLRVYRGGLWLTIGLHFGWNFTQGPILGFAVSGIAIQGVVQLQPQGAEWLSGGKFGLEGSALASLGLMTTLLVLYPWKNRYQV